MPHQSYRITGLSLNFQTDHPTRLNAPYLPFAAEPEAVPAFRADIRQGVPEELTAEGTLLYQSELYSAYQCENGFQRVYRDLSDGSIYAVSRYDWQTHRAEVRYRAEEASIFSDASVQFRHIGFEEVMLSLQRLALHASLVETPQGGLLFSGVSGIGKSTQAALWVRCRQAEQLNGDRPLLYQEAGRWLAAGSPYAGSSRCYVNRACPIRAIVFLSKAKACSLRPVPPGQAFRSLYAATVMNLWNPTYLEQATDLLTALAVRVPCYQLACTPDERAVECLERGLEERR